LNDGLLTALDYAEQAHVSTTSLLQVRGLTTDQRVSYHQEAVRLKKCIASLRKHGAHTGKEVLALVAPRHSSEQIEKEVFALGAPYSPGQIAALTRGIHNLEL